MSIESDFRALLAGHAPLVALVGDRIVQSAAPVRTATPLVVFSASHEHTHNLLGQVVADACTLTVQAWARTAQQADQVADAVAGALALAPLASAVAVTQRSSGHDEEVDLYATVMTVEWWD